MSASPKSKSGWAIIFIAVFFISPLKSTAAKEPIIRVFISNENKARFRADSVEEIFVQGVSAKNMKIKSFDLIYKNNKVKYSINNLNTWFELPKNFNLIIKNNDTRGIWYKNRRYSGELRVSLQDEKLNIINYLILIQHKIARFI